MLCNYLCLGSAKWFGLQWRIVKGYCCWDRGLEYTSVCHTVGHKVGPQLLKLLASFLYVSFLPYYHVQFCVHFLFYFPTF